MDIPITAPVGERLESCPVVETSLEFMLVRVIAVMARIKAITMRIVIFFLGSIESYNELFFINIVVIL